MHMPEGEPYPSTMPGFRETRDPERAVTRSRSRRKKKRVEFEDVQPQSIPNPTQEKFPRSHIKSGNTSIAHLRTYLTVAADREDDITIARAFILFMMGHLWFQTANDTVLLGYLAAVSDLDSAAQYDWGSAILASLYYGLDTAVTTGDAITGFVQLLPYWFYEYCGAGHLIVKEDVKYPTYLCLRAWERGNIRKTNDQATNLFILVRYHIDHRTVKTITWEPWVPLQVPNGNYEYYLGDRCWRQLEGEMHIPLDPPLSMSPHISPAALHEIRQAGFVDCHMLKDFQRMGNIDLFGLTTLRAGITPVVVTSASGHSLSQDFSFPGKAEGPDLVWYMEWTGRRERLPITRLRDPPPMFSSYGTEELWYLAHGMRRLALAESARDVQRPQEVEDELAIARRQIDSIDHQLYAHVRLQLRRGHDVRVMPLPPGGGARMRKRGLVREPGEAPQMSSSSSDSSIPDPPVLSSSSSDDDLIFNCAAVICVLHQTAMNIVVEDVTSSYGGSVMSRGPSESSDRLFDPTEFPREELSDVLLATFLVIFTAWFNRSSLRLSERIGLIVRAKRLRLRLRECKWTLILSITGIPLRHGGLLEDGVDDVELLLLVSEFAIWGERRGSPLYSAFLVLGEKKESGSDLEK
ncbi:hypothetical protein GIB67_039710 [Kingdonia uniflora]|uniref:Aminotransferase-like plant mobile domain-containing protein n=1 Tax=Kingdonia uniflora TaxID=39325 RepID=A0A7J7MPT7_9MAGN|nr:hypothetical protein GIB67_039710 [Kingdonia uniflora]